MTSAKAWNYQRQLTGKDEWLTPPEILTALGPFDLDPCSPINRPHPTACHHLTILDNGLLLPWSGRVFCNPPYSTASKWLGRCASHQNATALIFARTETKTWFTYVWPFAHSILFIKGRLTFLNLDASRPKFTSGSPSALIAYDAKNTLALAASNITGHLVTLRS